jgi:hypothetical protein
MVSSEGEDGFARGFQLGELEFDLRVDRYLLGRA